MTETQNTKRYDLADRTLKFSKSVFSYVKELQKNAVNFEVGKQLIRSSGSIGANYIEAEEALSKKDFAMRIKISRKEAKESIYWLKLSEPNDAQLIQQKDLVREATELMKIFGSIVEKTK